MRRALLIAAVVALWTAPAVSAQVVVNAPRIVTTRDVVGLRGSASRPGRVTVERRTSAGWRPAARRVTAGRRFELRWRAPAKPGVVTLRVVSSRAGRSRPWRTAVGAVEVVRPAAVLAAPAPGHSGILRYGGRATPQPGEFVAVGVGPATPAGFLGRVTARRSDGVQTVPATLEEALPEGRIESVATAGVAAARPLRRFGAPLSCRPGATGNLNGSLGASLDPRLALAWSHGRVRSARASATLRGNLDLGVEVAASGVCALDPLPVATWDAPPLRFFAGPIPVVVVPRTTLYASADAQVSAPAATRIRGGVRARAGLSYDGAVHPSGSFSQDLSADRPTVSGRATVAARLTPSVELLLYGAAGPRIDLGTGLQLDASPGNDPSWELSVPVELSAGLRVPGIDLPTRAVFSRNIPLARAASQPAPHEASAERARITWDSEADVDLHVWDAEGRHSSYRESGIPGVLLSKDDTNGFGPETLTEDVSAGRAFTYGLCYFDARGAGATTVSVRLTDPGGSVRNSTTTLRGEGDSALVGSSPPGSLALPSDGWCYGRH